MLLQRKLYINSGMLSVIGITTSAMTFSGATLNIFSPWCTGFKAQWL